MLIYILHFSIFFLFNQASEEYFNFLFLIKK